MKAIGEILSASISGFIAECWQDNRGSKNSAPLPRFGSFLKIDSTDRDQRVLAVVFDVLTGPQDNLHKPAALRLTRAQLRAEQPQIFALLKTELHATIIGYEVQGLHQVGLPPHPPEVHDFVYHAEAIDVAAMTNDLDFLRLVVRAGSVPSDELIAATIKEAYTARGGDYDFLVQAGQFLAHSFRGDYDRLSAILRRLKQQTTGHRK